jgi:hypothetical protein
MRKYRERLRRQLAVLRVTIHSDKFVVALIDSGWLSPAEALDRANVEAAAAALLAEWSRRWREWRGY